MPSEKKKKGKAHKFARPFYGPYRVIEVTANDAKVVPVDKPRSTPIFVALDRVRFCPDEVPPDQYWPTRRQSRKDHPIETSDDVGLDKLFPDGPEEPSPTRSWKGRLRPRPYEDARNEGRGYVTLGHLDLLTLYTPYCACALRQSITRII